MFSALTTYTSKILSWLGVIGCFCVLLIVVLLFMQFSYVNQNFEIILSDYRDIHIRNFSNQVGRIWGFTYFMGFTHKTNSIIPAPRLLISGKIKVAEVLEGNIKIEYKKDKQNKLENIKPIFVSNENTFVNINNLSDSLLSENSKIRYISTKSETLMLEPIYDIENNLLIISEKLTQFYWEFGIDCNIGEIIGIFSDFPQDIYSERKLLLSCQPQDSVSGVYGPASASIFLDGYEIKRGDSSIVDLTKKSIIFYETTHEIEDTNNISSYIQYELMPSRYRFENIKTSGGFWQYGKSAIVDKLGLWDFRGKCQTLKIFKASGNLKIHNKTRDCKLSDISIVKFKGVIEYLGTSKDEQIPITLIRGKAKLIIINDERFTLNFIEKIPDIFKWILPSIFIALLGIFIAGKSRKQL